MIVAVLDVNIVISAMLGVLGFSRQVVESLRAGRFVAATSAGIIAEVDTYSTYSIIGPE
jgi:predicted nucleic acid-binding protein